MNEIRTSAATTDPTPYTGTWFARWGAELYELPHGPVPEIANDPLRVLPTAA
jgi:hypothetical protein